MVLVLDDTQSPSSRTVGCYEASGQSITIDSSLGGNSPDAAAQALLGTFTSMVIGNKDDSVSETISSGNSGTIFLNSFVCL